MAIELQKGQKIELSKSFSKVIVGLSWDSFEQDRSNKRGLLRGFREKKAAREFLCDVLVFACGKGGTVMGVSDVVYWNNHSHKSGCIGFIAQEENGQDKVQVSVNLSDIPEEYEKISFLIMVHKAEERHQHFGTIQNVSLRVLDEKKRDEFCRYSVSQTYEGTTAITMGEIYRFQGAWKFHAIGKANRDTTLSNAMGRYK